MSLVHKTQISYQLKYIVLSGMILTGQDKVSVLLTAQMADCVIRKMPTQSATEDELQSFRPQDQFVDDGLLLGFTSIRQYRDIDRGISDLEIIVAPRDRTISYTNACLACTLLNRIHRAIII